MCFLYRSLTVLLSCVCFRLVTLFMDELGHISHWRAIMAGSLAGMVATIVTYPTDVIKTRLIVQNRLEPSYEGILHAFYKIHHQEGLRALYCGVSPAILGKTMLRWNHCLVFVAAVWCDHLFTWFQKQMGMFSCRCGNLQGTTILITFAAALLLQIGTKCVTFYIWLSVQQNTLFLLS